MTRKRPVSSYNPTLLAALIRGSSERVELRSTSAKELISLAFELNSLKKQVIAENHPARTDVERVKVGAYLDDDTPYVPNPVTHKLPTNRPTKVIIQPTNTRFGRILADAGIETPGPESATGRNAPDEPILPEPADDDELSQIIGETK